MGAGSGVWVQTWARPLPAARCPHIDHDFLPTKQQMRLAHSHSRALEKG